MSDRLPGTTYDNPIWYRDKWRIYLSDCAIDRFRYSYIHDDYDGAPIHSGDGPADNRCGCARTIDECKSEIDELLDEGV